jgi:hypothetical protein
VRDVTYKTSTSGQTVLVAPWQGPALVAPVPGGRTGLQQGLQFVELARAEPAPLGPGP